MTQSNAYSQYKENSVFTARPEELTLMLYNGLVKFIMKAQASLESKDYADVNESLQRAQDIVLEFQNTLDMKYELSHGLALLYDYMYRRLLEANIGKDNAILEEVLEFARDLRDTWSQAMRLARKQDKTQRSAAANG